MHSLQSSPCRVGRRAASWGAMNARPPPRAALQQPAAPTTLHGKFVFPHKLMLNISVVSISTSIFMRGGIHHIYTERFCPALGLLRMCANF